MDPWRKLAIEEYLLEDVEPKDAYFTYGRTKYIVIGKNQNAWKECRIQLLESEEVVGSPSSGGRAVFHDTGNSTFHF